MSCPKTVSEWWELLEEKLRDLVAEFHPGYRQQHDMAITAPAAEQVCDRFRQEIAEMTEGDPVSDFDRMKEAKDGLGLVRLLNQTWFGMPESTEVRSFLAFGALCDLCSESWVFNEEEE